MHKSEYINCNVEFNIESAKINHKQKATKSSPAIKKYDQYIYMLTRVVLLPVEGIHARDGVQRRRQFEIFHRQASDGVRVQHKL
jgi:hypothetical protein